MKYSCIWSHVKVGQVNCLDNLHRFARQEPSTHREVGLYGVVYDCLLSVEARNKVMHGEVVDGCLEVGLFCIHQHTHTLTRGTLAQQIQSLLFCKQCRYTFTGWFKTER